MPTFPARPNFPDRHLKAIPVNASVIQRLRQNAVSLMSRDQTVKQLANIVAELCLVCENQAKQIEELQAQATGQPEPETATAD